jgi:serine/threonine protein kinase
MHNNEAPPNRLLNLEGVQLPRGNYYLDKLVSVSNMSVIYKAVDQSSQRHVAVKILLNERYYRRFKNEVDITWGQKNNVASAIRYDIEGERLSDGTLVRYLVMKWLSGPSLSDRIRALRMESRSTRDLLDFSTRVLAKLATALDEMHRIGIVHLDIKPSNILFNTDEFETDEPYIIDFGIAHWIRETPEEQTVIEVDEPETKDDQDTSSIDQEFPGTANYMPPEQWAGAVNSGATDQYALAITIYEILSGRVSPFQTLLGVIATTTTASSLRTGRREAWRRGHEIEEPTPVHTYRPDLPRAVWDVLLKAMDKDPRRRYTTVGEFYRAFREAAQQPLAVLPSPEPELPPPQPDTALPAGGTRALPFVLGAAAILVLAGVGVIILANQPSGGSTPTPVALAALTETIEATPTVLVVVVTEEATDRPTVSAVDETGEATQGSALLVTEEATSTPAPSRTPTDTSEPPTRPPSETFTPTEEPSVPPTNPPTRRATNTIARQPSEAAVIETSPTETNTPTDTASSQPMPTATRHSTQATAPTASDTQTPSRTRRTPTQEPSDTPTASQTPSRTPSPTSTHTPTPEPADTLALLTQISDASRSANNFNCVDFIEAYDALESAVDTFDEAEQEIITPLFARSSPLLALNEFCANPRNRDDQSAQLPSNLASDEFRDLRTLVRAAIREIEALRENG